MLSRRHPSKAFPVLLALLLAAAPVLATHIAAPTNLDGTYDPDTELFTLTWDYDPGTTVDSFRVYIDGALAGTVTSQEYQDDLDGWGGGIRTYQVSALVPVGEGDETEEGDLSEEYQVFFAPGDPVFPCEVLGTSLEPNEVPPLGVMLHPQCLPPPIDGGSE